MNLTRAVSLSGSPPRLRETPLLFLLCVDPEGITPAPAGNTLIAGTIAILYEDHPRACGKHSFLDGLMSMIPGSPPRLRETHHSISCLSDVGGITPAPAGNTRTNECYRCSRWDHPRACGKHYTILLYCGTSLGSPPRLRETHTKIVRFARRNRITPAPAGNTNSFKCLLK